eukprot:GHVS01052294.1.p1 GENE.GHVS01052294.1~~GHVS01052294.1.p1  ORF type:complete len:204 (-),score=13.48 GHVS01052294.1:471-1082(-)
MIVKCCDKATTSVRVDAACCRIVNANGLEMLKYLSGFELCVEAVMNIRKKVEKELKINDAQIYSSVLVMKDFSVDMAPVKSYDGYVNLLEIENSVYAEEEAKNRWGDDGEYISEDFSIRRVYHFDFIVEYLIVVDFAKRDVIIKAMQLISDHIGKEKIVLGETFGEVDATLELLKTYRINPALAAWSKIRKLGNIARWAKNNE